MKILWFGNSPWSPSGYGSQAALFLPRIQALGHEVACLANFGLQGTRTLWQDITVFPSKGTKDFEALRVWHDEYRPDVVLSLMDVWPMKPRVWPDINVAAWTPVDHYPLPPEVHATLREPNITPIAMSRFGEEQMRGRKLEPLYVPHGVDTNLFRPRPDIKHEIRENLGVPSDAFLVGMVAANSSFGEFPRKGYPQALMAFGRFLAAHPDAWLYCHTKAADAMDLDRLIVTLIDVTGNTKLAERIKFPPPSLWYTGFPQQHMAELYCGFDVLLNPSMGEGFGIPIIEAQACGIPVIASDHSAMSEITQVGWLVGGDPWWDEAQASFGFNPAVDQIVVALEDAYNQRDSEVLRDAARKVGLQYDADLVTVQHWEPVLQELEKPREVAPLVLNGGPNREMRRAAKRKAKV